MHFSPHRINGGQNARRSRAEGQENDWSMPWRKYYNEKAWEVVSPTVTATTSVAPCTWFGQDLCQYFTAAKSGVQYWGALNPFNLNTALNYSDLASVFRDMSINDDGQRVDIDRVKAMSEVFNNSNAAVEVEVYYCMPRVESTSVNTHSIADHFNFDCANDSLTTSASTICPAVCFTKTSRPTPFQSTTFCTRMKVINKKSCRLGPGETLKVHWSSPLKGVRNTEFFMLQTETQEFTRYLLFRFVGQLGITTGVGPVNLPINCIVKMHEWIDARYLPSMELENQATAQSGALLPSATDANNITQTGNAQDARAFDEGN